MTPADEIQKGTSQIQLSMTIVEMAQIRREKPIATRLPGLRRSSVGGFGSFIPETSAAG